MNGIKGNLMVRLIVCVLCWSEGIVVFSYGYEYGFFW